MPIFVSSNFNTVFLYFYIKPGDARGQKLSSHNHQVWREKRRQREHQHECKVSVCEGDKAAEFPDLMCLLVEWIDKSQDTSWWVVVKVTLPCTVTAQKFNFILKFSFTCEA